MLPCAGCVATGAHAADEGEEGSRGHGERTVGPRGRGKGVKGVGTDGFVALSAELTGFSAAELWATGMVEPYRTAVRERVGGEQLDELAAAVSCTAASGGTPVRPADEALGELAVAVAYLWYTGSWPGLPEPVRARLGCAADDEPFTVHPDSYAAGLVWRTFGGHAPATHAPGFGSWSRPPQEPVRTGAGGGR